MKLPALVICIILSNVVIAQRPTLDKNGWLESMDNVNIYELVRPIPTENVFYDPNFHIWCGSVVKGKDNQYYMFYSRWPKAKGHSAWLPESEIALAKSDKPTGPFHHVKVVLPRRGTHYWDGVVTHNPAVIYHNQKYYLFYMGSTGKIQVEGGEQIDWWEFRNNQRIGVAVASDPEGVWTRFDQPVLDVSPDSNAYDALMVSNPSVTIDQQGNVILVYKQVEKNGTKKGGKVRFGVAFSNSLLGPFVKHAEPIFELNNKSAHAEWMVAEDPFIWNYKGVNYALVRDVKGYFTHDESALALLRSVDAKNWSLSTYPCVISPNLQFEDGYTLGEKLERPSMYFENGVPIVLFGAVRINNRSHDVNIAIPLNMGLK